MLTSRKFPLKIVGCQILILGLFLHEAILLVNGAAVPSFGNTQSQFPKDATDSVRNASSPSDFKLFLFSFSNLYRAQLKRNLPSGHSCKWNKCVRIVHHPNRP